MEHLANQLQDSKSMGKKLKTNHNCGTSPESLTSLPHTVCH